MSANITPTPQNSADHKPATPGTPRFFAEHMQELAQMEMHGDSMTPTIKHGDILYVDPKINEYAGDNVYVIDRGHELEARRIQQSIAQPGQLLLICDNKAYEVETTDSDSLRIRGLVVGIITARSV